MKKGCERKRLGDCCEIVSGGTPKSAVSAYWGGPHRWITPAEMGGLQSPYLGDSRRTLTDAGLKNSSARLLPPHSVILSSRAPIGHLVINTVPMATNQGCKGLVPSTGLDAAFLYYCLLGMVPQLDAMGTGATFKELSAGKLREVCIPVPTLPEQRRIVAILDEAFEGIAAAKANAEQNLRNTKEVFESQLTGLFTLEVGGWPECRLSEVCREITVGHVGSMKGEYTETGIPFLRSQNIRPFEVTLENIVYVSQRFHKSLKKSILRPGDLAIVRTGYPGTTAVVPESLPEANCSDLVIMRVGDGVDPNYIAAFLNSSYGRHLVGSQLVGAAQKHFNVTAAKQVAVRFPPLPEQTRVVNRVMRMRDQVQACEIILTRKEKALDELKASLLHQAFTGKL